MTFNSYITLDSKQYRTNTKWMPSINPPSTSRETLGGSLDITYGPISLIVWTGEIVAAATPETGFGSIVDLRASLAKKQPLTLIDHYNTTYTVHAIGPFTERSLSPDWDSPTNTFYVAVKLKAKAA